MDARMGIHLFFNIQFICHLNINEELEMGFNRRAVIAKFKLKPGVDLKNINGEAIVGAGDITIKTDASVFDLPEKDARVFFNTGYQKGLRK